MSGLNKLSIGAWGVLVLAGLLGIQYFFGEIGKYKTEINLAKQNAKTLEAANETLEANVKEYTEEQVKLKEQAKTKDSQIVALKAENEKIKTEAEQERLNTFTKLKNDADSVKNFKEVFPDFATKTSTVLIKEVVTTPTGKSIVREIDNIMMPTAYVDSFARLKIANNSLTKRLENHEEIDDLNEQIKTLQNEVLRFEEKKVAEFKRGYELAYGMFKTTNEEYIKLMKEKRFSNIFKTIGAFASGAALGVNF